MLERSGRCGRRRCVALKGDQNQIFRSRLKRMSTETTNMPAEQRIEELRNATDRRRHIAEQRDACLQMTAYFNHLTDWMQRAHHSWKSWKRFKIRN